MADPVLLAGPCFAKGRSGNGLVFHSVKYVNILFLGGDGVKAYSITPTPTTSVMAEKIRGFSLDILSELSAWGGLTTSEIAENLDKSKKYVRVYLYRLYKYACIDKRLYYGWEITPFGADVLNYNSYKYNKGNRRATEEQHLSNRRATLDSTVSHKTHISRQLNLSLFSEDPNVSEPERVVVLALAQHYELTGEKYRYYADMYDFCEQMGLSSISIGEIMAKLKQDGVLYIRKETMFEGISWKIGLKKDFVERLQNC